MQKKMLAGILLLAAFNANSEQLDGYDDDIDDSDLPEWTEDAIDPMHERVSRWVNRTSRNIDGFFGTEDHLTTRNRSYLRISQEFEWEETEDMDMDTRLRFRLDLPTTKDRLRLIIESDPEETQGTLSEQQASRIRPDQRDSGSSIIGLSQGGGEVDRTLGWETKASAGLRFRFPLDPYVRLTAERLWDIGNGPWQLESFNRASWFNSDGYSVRTRWDIGRPIDDARHLRFITNVQWREEYDNLEFAESAELYHILDGRSAIRYAAVAIGESASSPRMTNYILLTQYRRNIHKDIIFADLTPELRFARESNFDPRWALTLRFEVYFRGEVVDRRWRSDPAEYQGYSPERVAQAFNPASGPRRADSLQRQRLIADSHFTSMMQKVDDPLHH